MATNGTSSFPIHKIPLKQLAIKPSISFARTTCPAHRIHFGLVTVSMQRRPSFRRLEFPCILRNPMVNYRIHNSPPPAPILSHMNPIHALPSYFFQNKFSIIYLFMPRSFKWSLPHQNTLDDGLITLVTSGGDY